MKPHIRRQVFPVIELGSGSTGFLLVWRLYLASLECPLVFGLGKCIMTTRTYDPIVELTPGRTHGPVVYEREHSSGGHFLAWEKPDEVVRDLWSMFGTGGPCCDISKR